MEAIEKTRVTELCACACGLGWKTARALANMLRKNTVLKVLNVKGECLCACFLYACANHHEYADNDEFGTCEVFEAIEINKTLESFSTSLSRLDMALARRIARAIELNTTLRTLKISGKHPTLVVNTVYIERFFRSNLRLFTRGRSTGGFGLV